MPHNKEMEPTAQKTRRGSFPGVMQPAEWARRFCHAPPRTSRYDVIALVDLNPLVMRPFLLLFAILLSGCNLLGEGDCTADLWPMIIARVRDARTGQPLFAGVTLLAYTSDARDSVTVAGAVPPSVDPVINLYPRVFSGGVYTVEVRLQGYETWRRLGVRVGQDHCGHTIAARLNVALEPL